MKLKWPLLGVKDDVKYALPATKLDRHDPRNEKQRFIILTCKSIISVDAKKWNIKEQVDLKDINAISTSSLRDGVVAIHCKNSKRGDFLLRNDVLCIEFGTILLDYCKDLKLNVSLNISNSYSQQ